MSAVAPTGQLDLHYGPDDVPKPLFKAVGLGFQHVLTMFGATILVPIIMAPALGFEGVDIAILISSVFIASGIATALQLTIGSRLPIVQGVSFAFLAPFFAVAAEYQGAEAMRFIGGMIIAGAVVEIVIGYGGLMGLLRRFVTPITIAPVIALIGLSLFGAASGLSSGHWPMALLTLALIFFYALILAPRHPFMALFPILLAILTSYALAWVLTIANVFEEGSAVAVSFADAAATPWIRGVEVGAGGLLFPWGTPQFAFGFFVIFLAAYLASMIESFGDYHAISRIAGLGDPDSRTINRGIGSEGVGCVGTALVGGFASTSYSENIGLVGLTRVASRVVVLIGAGILVLLGLVAKFGGLIATIPIPIVGGAFLALFGLIAAVGLSNLRRVDMDSQRNLMIIGFVLFAGFVFPAYFDGLEEPFTFFGIDWLSRVIEQIFGSAIATAAVLGLVLDNLIPGTPEERGMLEVVDVTSTAAPPAHEEDGTH
jgi:solute carrier family 23 (nucleobase transporter), member 1